MQNQIASLTFLFLIGLVIIRVFMLKRHGIEAMNFGKIDKTDFFIPPFALMYIYIVFAEAFHWPSFTHQALFNSEIISWVGVVFCLLGLVLFLLSTISFGRSFRVGIDIELPDRLVTDGIFTVTRNPIYLAFWMILVGQFLVFSNWILIAYLVAATWLFHRQVLREEAFLSEHYGKEYEKYRSRVRRYL